MNEKRPVSFKLKSNDRAEHQAIFLLVYCIKVGSEGKGMQRILLLKARRIVLQLPYLVCLRLFRSDFGCSYCCLLLARFVSLM